MFKLIYFQLTSLQDIYSLYFLLNLSQKKSSSSIYQFPFNSNRFLKKFSRFVKRNLLKIVIAWSPGYFIVLMLISYNHYYVNNCINIYVLLFFQFLLIAISMVLQSTFLVKTSILVFTIAVDCVMMPGNIKKINLLAPEGSRNSDNMNILSFFFIFVLSFNLLRKRKKGSSPQNYSYQYRFFSVHSLQIFKIPQ